MMLGNMWNCGSRGIQPSFLRLWTVTMIYMVEHCGGGEKREVVHVWTRGVAGESNSMQIEALVGENSDGQPKLMVRVVESGSEQWRITASNGEQWC